MPNLTERIIKDREFLRKAPFKIEDNTKSNISSIIQQTAQKSKNTYKNYPNKAKIYPFPRDNSLQKISKGILEIKESTENIQRNQKKELNMVQIIVGGVLLIATTLAGMKIWKNLKGTDFFTTDSLYDTDYIGGSGYDETKGSANRIKNKIIAEATKQGIDPALALAVAEQESHFNQSAISEAGALGIFQLMPGTAKGLGVNPNNEDENIRGGIKYLAQLSKMYKGDTTKILAGYNSGPGNVAKYGGVPPFKETQRYVKEVGERRVKFKKELSTFAPPAKPLPTSQTRATGSYGYVGKVPIALKATTDNTKLGSWRIKKDVMLSGQSVDYIKGLGSYGTQGDITSGMESSLHRPGGERSHYSGNKIDIGARTYSQFVEVIARALEHPATVEIGIEGRMSTAEANNIVTGVKQKYPQLFSRVLRVGTSASIITPAERAQGKTIIWYRLGKSDPHIDILFDPNKVVNKSTKSMTQSQIDDIQEKINQEKINQEKKVQRNQVKPKSVQPTATHIISPKEQKAKVSYGITDDVNIKNTYHNSIKKKKV